MTMAEPDLLVVETADGRRLEVLVQGSAESPVLLYHSGTPSGVASFPTLSDEAASRGLRLVSYSRPGYGESTPHPGRSVADGAADSAAIVDALGVEAFVTLGWSGGGPHAMACAAVLPDRCRAGAVLAGVAPYGAEGLDWLHGMGPENVEEFGAALAGEQPLTTYLEAQRTGLQHVTGAEVAEALGGLVPEVDKAALTGELADYLAASFRRAMLRGVDGWRDDDLAFTKPWGFEPAAISVPMTVWQGGQDKMVPFAHGQWLAEALTGARLHLDAQEGHLSLMRSVGLILDDLLELAERT